MRAAEARLAPPLSLIDPGPVAISLIAAEPGKQVEQGGSRNRKVSPVNQITSDLASIA
jgi:hypothetical protein